MKLDVLEMLPKSVRPPDIPVAEAWAVDAKPVEVDGVPNHACDGIFADEPQAISAAPDAGMVDDSPDAARNGVYRGDGDQFEPI